MPHFQRRLGAVPELVQALALATGEDPDAIAGYVITMEFKNGEVAVVHCTCCVVHAQQFTHYVFSCAAAVSDTGHTEN